MATYVYNIFRDESVGAEINEWEERRRAAGKAPRSVIAPQFASGRGRGTERIFRRLVGRSLLGRIAATDKLYVVAHGSADGIGYYANPDAPEGSRITAKAYTATSLANHLLQNGLTINFVDLRIGSCESGIGGLRSIINTNGLSFARNVRDAMRRLGYASLTGYDGDYVPIDYFSEDDQYHSRVSPTPAGQRSSGRASLYRVRER